MSQILEYYKDWTVAKTDKFHQTKVHYVDKFKLMKC